MAAVLTFMPWIVGVLGIAGLVVLFRLRPPRCSAATGCDVRTTHVPREEHHDHQEVAT
jgi:hypothetical protein